MTMAMDEPADLRPRFKRHSRPIMVLALTDIKCLQNHAQRSSSSERCLALCILVAPLLGNALSFKVNNLCEVYKLSVVIELLISVR
jgi:hypothetical protein